MPSIISLSLSADWFLSQTLVPHSSPSPVSPRLAVSVFCFPVLPPAWPSICSSLTPSSPSAIPHPRHRPRGGGRALLLLLACVLGDPQDHEDPQLQV